MVRAAFSSLVKVRSRLAPTSPAGTGGINSRNQVVRYVLLHLDGYEVMHGTLARPHVGILAIGEEIIAFHYRLSTTMLTRLAILGYLRGGLIEMAAVVVIQLLHLTSQNQESIGMRAEHSTPAAKADDSHCTSVPAPGTRACHRRSVALAD
jgi:hypothetical protein